ncbi:MAG: flagellar biosynthesis protein FlhA [Fibrobacterota bacterium]
MEAIERSQGFVVKLLKNNDYLVAAGVVGVLVLMLIPLPTFFLDILLSANISLSIVVLMVSMYTKKTTDFSVFPGLLLVITLFRLGLNVASTRLILTEANAGEVINAFGSFVTKGNVIVGFIIFIILVIIQFVVITKGATRIAEVAARFTLDAMPGKQMAVDADLNSGLINEAEARERRDTIRREADFYGAMDGASKFVRGDAVAGIIITLINVLGGFVIGIAMLNMDFLESLKTYTLLTIGDGLVTQIPALIVSTASGIIVTRAATTNNLGSEITGQLLQSPKALFIASGLMGLFAIVPGFPFLPFLALSVFAGTAGFAVKKGLLKEKPETTALPEKDAKKGEEKIEDYLNIDQMEMEIGYGLIPLVDIAQGGDLLERITMIRRQCATEMGIIVPPIRIRDNIQLKPNEYRIKIKNVAIARGELMSGSYLAMNPGNVAKQIRGIKTTEPAFGLPALWITESQKEEAELAGYTVVELPAVIATHITEIIKNHASEIVSRQDVKTLINNVKESSPTVVEELIPGKLAHGEVQKVLQNLLKERVSIRDLSTILEILSDHVDKTKDVDVLTEYVRDGLSRQICDQVKDANGAISVLTLEPKLEQLLEVSMQHTERGNKLVLRPEMASRIIDSAGAEALRVMSLNEQPLILTSPLVRSQFRRLIEAAHPGVSVLSYNEIAPGVNIRSIGMIKVEDK